MSSPSPIALLDLVPGKSSEHDLKAGETHSYSFSLSHGQFLDATAHQGKIGLLVRVWAPDGTTLMTIDSPVENAPITVEAKTAGYYRMDVFPYSKEAKPGRYTPKINELLSAQVYVKRVAEELRKQKVVISWLKANAVPLKTVEAGNGFTDLLPLKQILKDVRFVGLGEATHGTR